MKKAIGIAACLLLEGCYNDAPSVDVGPDIGTKWPRQDTAPAPWVRVVPSKRTLALKDVNFSTIAEQIRYDINYAPHRKKFERVRLVLVDYTILPHASPSLPSTPNAQDQTPPAQGKDQTPPATSTPSAPTQDQTPPATSTPSAPTQGQTPPATSTPSAPTQDQTPPATSTPSAPTQGQTPPATSTPSAPTQGQTPPATSTPSASTQDQGQILLAALTSDAPAQDQGQILLAALTSGAPAQDQTPPASSAPNATAQDQTSPTSSAPNAMAQGQTPSTSSAPNATAQGQTPPTSSAPNATDQGQTPSTSSAPNATDQGHTPHKPSVRHKARAVAKSIVVNNEDYSTQYESRPKRYVMTLSFYECDKLPPDAPLMEETIFMRVDKAPSQEAMRLMAHSVIEDLHSSDLKKLQVSLD